MKRGIPILGALLACAALLAFIDRRDHATWTEPARTASTSFRPATDAAPAPLPFLPLDADSFYWLAHADALATGSTARVRWTNSDNPPAGRPVYWSSPLLWALDAVRAVLAAAAPSVDAKEAAASLTPLLFWFLLFVLAAPLLERLAGLPGVAAGLAGLLFLPGLQRDFSALRLDHHGLLSGALFLAVAGLASAATSPKPIRLVLASAAAGALGLWIQAPVAALVINATAVAAGFHLWALFDARRDPPPVSAAAWQTWGRAGGLLALAAYAVEYVPSHVGMRLEVNHPLYALNWWALGEGLAWLTRRESPGERPTPLPALLALAGAALLPGTLWFGPADWFLLRDTFLLRVHTLIEEFAPLRAVFSSWPALCLALGPGLLAIPAAVALLLRARLPGNRSFALITTLAAALAATSLAWQHNRFLGLANALLTLLVAAALTLLSAGPARWAAALAATLLAFLPAAVSYHTLGAQAARGEPRAGFVERVQRRDLALRLRQLVPPAERTAIAGFDESPFLNFIGGFQSTGGLYWENRDGLRKTTLFFTATDEQAARALLATNRIRCVVLETSPETLARLYYCRHGNVTDDGVRQTMAFRLASGQNVPSWLERLPLNLTEAPGAGRFAAYRVSGDAASWR